jgi:AcrR family transcriptional regulator
MRRGFSFRTSPQGVAAVERQTKGPQLRRDAAINRDRLIRAAEEVFAARGSAATLDDVAKAAGVGPATLYRRFANKDALVAEVLSGYFQRLIALAEIAEHAPAQRCLDVFLQTVGVELAEKAGLAAPEWGDLAPKPLVEELRRRSSALLTRAQQSGAVRRDVNPADITAAVWALRGVIHSERTDADYRGQALWRRHLQTILRGFRNRR